jgi:hypothetical protein
MAFKVGFNAPFLATNQIRFSQADAWSRSQGHKHVEFPQIQRLQPKIIAKQSDFATCERQLAIKA